MLGWKRIWAALATLALVVAVTPAASGASPEPPQRDPIDWEAPIVVDPDPGGTTQGLFDEDSTGLIPKTPFVQRYSLDQDHWEVWLCGPMETSMSAVIADLEAATVNYFDSISGGVYEPVFHEGGTKPADADCLQEFIDGTYPTVTTPAPEGVLIIDGDYGSGGYASPGTICISDDPDCGWIDSTFPGNRRYAVLGEPIIAGSYWSVTAHELGHTLQWPHSNSGTGGEYDNPLDLMSGNETTGGWTEKDPYDTLSYSRFQSGWIAEADIVVADGGHQLVTLQPHTASGDQLLVIRTALPGKFYVFGARTTSTYDPIPSTWQGVEVYEVDYYCDEPAFGGAICPGIYRDHTQQPPSPGGVGHVLGVGESVVLEGLTVTVTGTTATGYTLVADVKPSAPGTPTSVPDDEQATISWTAAGGAGSPVLNYDLEVEDRDGGGSSVTDVGVTLSTVAAGLTNGTTYRARVRATNSLGDGPWSAWSTDFTPGTVAEAPGTPSVSGGNGAISASWDSSGDSGGFAITNYELQINDETDATNSYVDAGAVLTKDIDGLTNGHSYRLRVRAENALGAGAWSGWSTSVIPATTPGAPLNPTATITGADTADATWSPPTDDGGLAVTGYELVLENRTAGGLVSHDPGTATTYGLTALIAGDTYRYQVRAGNALGDGPWSAWSDDFALGDAPTAPGVPTVTAADASISASWTAPGDDGGVTITNYKLDLYDESAGSSVNVDVGAVLTKDLGGLINGHSYRLQVRAENAVGAGPWSGWSTTVTPVAAPSAPGTPAAVPRDKQATVSWTAAADGGSPILNYDLEVDEVGGGSTVTDVGVTLEATSTGLDNGTTYRARVRATNAIGDGPWSGWSADFVPGTVPAAPGVPDAVVGDSSIAASWTAPGDDGGFPVTNYELDLNDYTSGTNTHVDVGTSLAADLDGLTNGHTYRLRVRAENALGAGPWSPWSDGVVPLAAPDAPLNPTITVTAVDEATASWSPPADDGGASIAGYELLLENRTGGGSASHDPGAATTYALTGLTTGDTYRYRVRAENVEGWGEWSAWSPDFIPGTVPSAPGVPDVTAGDAEITAAWTAASGLGSAVDTYEVELEKGGTVTLGAVLAHTFTGLVNDDDYRVRARAHNDSGWGPWSAWSATVTPQAQPAPPPPPPPPPPPIPTDTFIDDDDSVFEADIEWLAAAGITRGCNPPVNDRFCPEASVTRGQMAAFLARALDLPAGDGVDFTDDDASVFESDIEKLAAAGITRGCNPPVNDRFCPEQAVTRGQMAAFLARALDLPAGTSVDFVDDDGSVFESDIEKLAVAGITLGCNPPTNDMFCPAALVTRAQMAAFLHRALS